jgi:uncharacterized protein YjaZ
MFELNGKHWKVLLVSSNHPMLRKNDGTRAIGACDYESQSIYIKDNLDLAFMKKVICHEVAHAAMFSYDVQLGYDQEEMLVDLIATYSHEIISITNKIFNKIKNGSF